MLLQNSEDFGKCAVQRYRNNDADNSAVCNSHYCQMWPFSEELIMKMY